MQKEIDRLVKLNKLTFSTKQDFDVWRAQWKKDYNQVSTINRKLKNERKTVYRKEGMKITKEDYILIGANPNWPVEYHLDDARGKARSLLCQLAAQKKIRESEIKACAA